MRALRHAFGLGRVRRHFPPATLDAIQHAIAAGEARHRGEIVFAVEATLGIAAAWRGRSARERAREVFAQLRVWDTEYNSGVLIYLLLADRAIEIVADRGIAARVDDAQWQGVCELLRQHCRRDDPAGGALAAVDAVNAILARYLPAGAAPARDELPDRPVLL